MDRCSFFKKWILVRWFNHQCKSPFGEHIFWNLFPRHPTSKSKIEMSPVVPRTTALGVPRKHSSIREVVWKVPINLRGLDYKEP